MEHRKLTLVGFGVMASIVAACLAMISSNFSHRGLTYDRRVAAEPVFGMKVRLAKWLETDDEQNRLIDFCLEYGVHHLIVPIQVVPSGADQGRWVVAAGEQLTQFAAKAAGRRITVEGLVPVADDIQAENHDTVTARVRAVSEFNKTLPLEQRLLGIHCEVDLNILPSWQTSQRKIIVQQCLDLFTSMRLYLQQEDVALRLAASIPHDLEELSVNDDTPLVEYNGQNKSFSEHLQDLTDYVAVGCPRRFDDANGPSSDQIEPQLGYAQWADRSVWLALETSRLSNRPTDSYYGRPAWEFWLHKREAEQALRGRREFGGVLVSTYDTFQQMVSQQNNQAESSPTQYKFGMWVWHEKWVRDEENHEPLLAFCKTHGINLLPIQVHLDPASVKRGQPQLSYPDQLRKLIDKARRKNIRIEALDGAPEMAKAENRPHVLAILDVILAFNRTLPPDAGLIGVHYDIEPYLLPEWKTPQRMQIMRQFLELLEAAKIKIKLDGLHMTLAASIPFWYDEKTNAQDSCILKYNGQRKNFHEHIQDLTDYTAIMSYRRNALGEDSISHHIEVERAYAEWIGRYVCAGMETLKIEDHPEVSFHGVPPAEFWFQKEKLEHALGKSGGFGGIVVHSYETFAPYLTNSQNEVPENQGH